VVAARLGDAAGVPAKALTGVRPGTPRKDAMSHLASIKSITGLEGDVVETENAAALVDSLSPGTLVVLGAPGGSWLTRQFFGPGARLRSHAPAGTVVVRDAAPKVFQRMAEPTAIGPHASVADVLRIATTPTIPVADDRRLLGIARISRLVEADHSAEVGELVEDPPFVAVDDHLESLEELLEFFDHGPIPVVDREGRLAGVLDPDIFDEWAPP
jgi:CBS domain-containing protein